jgi:hypothetical protein
MLAAPQSRDYLPLMTKNSGPQAEAEASGAAGKAVQPENGAKPADPAKPKEIGGPQGPEPTRYGDWERNGRVSDF